MISHYRRLLADDGHVVMNWEPYPPEQIVRPLGVADPEVGVVKVVAAGDPNDPAKPGRVLALLFNHTGHPNVLSGDNYLLQRRTIPASPRGCWRKNWAAWRSSSTVRSAPWILTGCGIATGRASTGQGVRSPAASARPQMTITPSGSPAIRGACTTYTLPGRRITDEEWRWAQGVLAETGGQVAAVADGVGDDYKAAFYRELHDAGPRDLPVDTDRAWRWATARC